MKLNGKLICVLALPGLLVVTGCSGIHASHSVSPASFFLPGLLKVDPPPAAPDSPTPLILPLDHQLAQVN